MTKINQEEYEVLKALDDKWEWIARDKDGTLVMGAGKNERYLDGWFPPENIGDSLVADEINAVKVISEWGNLFQFIQWEDEDSYNIQELIEEYENSPEYVTYISNERTRILSNDLWSKLESEGTEVNKQKLIKKWESAIEAAEFYGRGKEDRLIEYMRNFVDDLNQLDEPEVLSQELPVIPKFMAEWYESEGKQSSWWNWFYKWGRDEGRTELETKTIRWMQDFNEEAFVNMFLHGYTVEKERKYYVLDKENATLLKKSAVGEGIAKSVGTNIYNAKSWKNEEEYQLTEQEIKDYDERYWPFAVKVEELKE